ncbi:MAG: hypothetical protein OEV85_00860 [Candidatus Thorarchaeota archaeon]|nr:hypothetical protein [Candidatus Thorarchaeota archaeon]
MIRLIGILTTGGVPIKVKSAMDADGQMIIGPLIEAAKALSNVIGSGEVRKLGFRENTLIVTECKKGYTIVALVSKAEDYMDSLLRVIADAIDDSDLATADGSVNDSHERIIDQIIHTYTREHVETGFLEILPSVWNPILSALKQSEKLSVSLQEVEALLSKEESVTGWNKLKAGVNGTLKDALLFALQGEFDRACAMAMNVEGALAGVFCIKMGALTHTMTKVISPPLTELKQIAAALPEDYPFTDFARSLVSFTAGELIPADYSRVFRETVNRFEFKDDEEHLLLGFMFLDARVVDYQKFAQKLLNLYREKSEVFCSYIESIDERGKLFEKLYSITNYGAFRDELGMYKSRITSILGNINWVLDSDLLWELKKEGKGIEIGVTASLKLQNYIAILTALAESPVLTIGERREVLEEVLMLYRDYFRDLMMVEVPLFSYTLDSVFQSLSVANAEYYFLTTGESRKQHLDQSIDFLSDIYHTIEEEWPKSQVRFSLFVVGNALSPVFTRADILSDEEVRLVYLAMKLLDVNTIDAIQITKPEAYATNLGNTITTLAALAARLLETEERTVVLKRCVEIILDTQEWFISRGVICRDDIMSASFHSSLVTATLEGDELERIVNRVIALNRIAIQDPVKYDYEVAMISSPYIGILIDACNRLSNKKYLQLARDSFDSAYRAWIKYGFPEKAVNFKKKYGNIAC